jgi:RNA polymerase sigma factor (sigma-70 family)
LNRPTDESDLKLDLDQIIAALPPNQRRAVLLYGWGYTQQEIAEKTGVTQQAISKILKNVVVKMVDPCVLSLIEDDVDAT